MSKNSKLFPSFDDLAKRKTANGNDSTNNNNENNNNDNNIINNNDLNNNNNADKTTKSNDENEIENSSLVDNVSIDNIDNINKEQTSNKEEQSEYNDLDSIRVSPPKRKYTKKMSVLERLAKEKKKKVQHGFYLDHDVSEALKSIAGTGRNGVASAFVNEAIRDALEREGLL